MNNKSAGQPDAPAASELAEQLIDLESKFSFQEDTLQQLNDVVVAQQTRIDALQRRVNQLQEQLAEQIAERAQPSSAASEKPPHY